MTFFVLLIQERKMITPVKKQDLLIKKCSAFSYNNFSHGDEYYNHKMYDEAMDIYLGRWRLTTAIYCSGDDTWRMEGVYSKFKTKDGLLRGILNRLNG